MRPTQKKELLKALSNLKQTQAVKAIAFYVGGLP